MSLFVTTTAGNAAATVAEVSGPKIAIKTFKLTTSIFSPTAALTALPGSIVYTGTCSHFSSYSADTVQVVCEVPADVGPFNYGGIGLYLADGTMYASMSYNTLQLKAVASTNGYSDVKRIRCLLKLVGNPTATFNFYTNDPESLGEVPNFTYVTSPSTSGAVPAMIVHEPTPDGESILIYKNTANTWTPERYLAVANDTVTASTANSLSCAYFTPVPNSLVSGQYLVQTSLGQIRSSASVNSGVFTPSHAFAPTPAVGSTIRVYKYIGDSVELSTETVDELSEAPATSATSAVTIISREILFNGAPVQLTRSSDDKWTLDNFFAITPGISPISVTLQSGDTVIELPATYKLTNLTAKQYVVKLAASDRFALVSTTPNNVTLRVTGDITSWLSAATPIMVYQSIAAYCQWHISGNPHPQYVLPPGLVIPYYGHATDKPNGFVLAGGGLISRTIYPELFALVTRLSTTIPSCVISDAAWVKGGPSVRTHWSLGDGSTNFRVPDFRGLHPRFWDFTRGVDPGRALGSYQDDDVKSHVHGGVPLKIVDTDRGPSNSSLFSVDNVGYTEAYGGTETRVKNVALTPMISVGRISVVDTTGPTVPPADVIAPPPAPPPVGAPPSTDFTASATTHIVDGVIWFYDTTLGSPTSWSWNFGDGYTSTAQNPSHAYIAAGTYTVSLTATNANGSDTETKVGYITVTEPEFGE